MKYFAEHEFPAGALPHMHPGFLSLLDRYREAWGKPIHPSPLQGGWARFEGSKTSRHYAVGRQSDAGDVFVQGNIRDAWLMALAMPFGGIGIYFDTRYLDRPWPMLHLDTRPERVLWARINKDTYVYPAKNAEAQQLFFSLLTNQGKQHEIA